MENTANHHHLVILGAGPAGYTAAIYAARANLNPVIIGGLQIGGQLTTTTEVENFPGFPDGVQGPELMELMKKQAERFGTQLIPGLATKVDFSVRPFRIWIGATELTADAVILATGASAKYLGLESESKYKNRGVSGCATCDGFFFRNKKVAVIGGGDTAAEEALYLANICKSVSLIHRRDTLRASKIMAERVLANPKIKPEWNSEVDEFVGDGTRLTGIRLRDASSGETRELEVAGAFIAIGHKPNTDFLVGQIDMDEQGYIIAQPGSTRTNIPGVFAAGDVADRVYRQGITSAGSGCMAAMDAERWLGEQLAS